MQQKPCETIAGHIQATDMALWKGVLYVGAADLFWPMLCSLLGLL